MFEVVDNVVSWVVVVVVDCAVVVIVLAAVAIGETTGVPVVKGPSENQHTNVYYIHINAHYLQTGEIQRVTTYNLALYLRKIILKIWEFPFTNFMQIILLKDPV